ncbi:MAG TPA: diguanylate cyclase [Sulfurimonas sp.]
MALFISYVVMNVYHVKKDMEWSVASVSNLAKVSAKNIAAALTFLDEKAVESMLIPTLANEDIISIRVYDTQANCFVSLGESSQVKKKRTVQEFLEIKNVSSEIDLKFIEVVSVISLEDEIIGYLEIIKTTSGIKKKFYEQLLFSVFVVVLTLIVIFFLSVWFEKIFSKPIYLLLDAMKSIQRNANYNASIVSDSKDEFNELYKEFNKLMQEVQKRDALLKQNNLSLENLVYSTANELEKTREDLKEFTVLAEIDSLSGLANRRVAMQRFEQMLETARQNAHHIGVLMADMDHFKSINDTYGHQVGDEVIKAVAFVLLENTRKTDLAARIGGEEFLILFDNGDAKIVYEIAQRIREKIEKMPIKVINFDVFHITISLGFCSVIPKDETLEELLKKADDALYRAKKEGRNRVVAADIA